jgi:type IX secretion system PorP/SprF family membrane protein
MNLPAQQLPVYSLYRLNGQVLNPGMTGWDNYMLASVTYRQQWIGMEGAPLTFTANYRTDFDEEKMGIGCQIIHDKAGPISMTGASVQYAYILNLDDYKPSQRRRLGIGINFDVFQFRIKGEELILHDQVDALVIRNTAGKLLPNAGVGVFYHDEKYYGGISAQQLIPLDVRIQGLFNETSNIKRAIHLNFNAGAKFPVGQGVSYFEPTVWVRYSPNSPVNGLIMANYHHEDIINGGIGFSTDRTFTLDLGVKIKNTLHIGYAFSTQFSTLQSQLGTSHEIMLSYFIRKNDEY